MAKICYNRHMTTQYRIRELREFAKFCLRHGLKFATMAEYNSALSQYFKKV